MISTKESLIDVTKYLCEHLEREHGLELDNLATYKIARLVNNRLQMGMKPYEMYGVKPIVEEITITDLSDKITFTPERRHIRCTDQTVDERTELARKIHYNLTLLEEKNSMRGVIKERWINLYNNSKKLMYTFDLDWNLISLWNQHSLTSETSSPSTNQSQNAEATKTSEPIEK